MRAQALGRAEHSVASRARRSAWSGKTPHTYVDRCAGTMRNAGVPSGARAAQRGRRMKELHGKVAVVTGAASGIGRAMADRFVAEGMKVVLADVENAGWSRPRLS